MLFTGLSFQSYPNESHERDKKQKKVGELERDIKTNKQKATVIVIINW